MKYLKDKINKGIMVNLKNTVTLAFLFTIFIGFNGCYKDNIEFEPYENPVIEEKGDIAAFFSKIPNLAQSVTIAADEKSFVISSNKTVFELNPKSFLNEDGSEVDGNIDFKYYEMLDPALFLFKGLPTISNGQLLKTEGVFKFEAFQNGKALKLAPGKGIKVRLPVDAPSPKAFLFLGTGEGEKFNWELTKLSPVGNTNEAIRIAEWGIQVDSVIQDFVSGYGYEFDCPLFHWINVDIFVEVAAEDKTTVCVELPEIYSDKNTIVFMLFKDYDSILALRPNPDKKQFCEPYGATPIGFKVKFIVISNQGEGKFHFALQDAVIAKEHVEFIIPAEKSLEEIIKIIEGL